MRIVKESVDRFFDYDLHIETRTLLIADQGEDGVDSGMSSRVIKALHLFQNASVEKPITVILNSFGGCWFNGMAIYDAIAACPCPVTAVVYGAAMSMGSIILQAADTRVIHPNATMMIHDGYETRVDDTPATFENWAAYSRFSRQRMYQIYAARSGKPVAFWRKKCAADSILTAQEAKKIGLVDKVYGDDE